MEHEITVDKESIEFPANWEEGSADSQTTFTVTIDGKDTGGGFRYEAVGNDWFGVSLLENKFTITATENFNVGERNGYILLHHNAIVGEAGEITVPILQTGMNCSVAVDSETVTFKPLNQEDEDRDTKEITVTVTGGNKKFIVYAYNEYKLVDNKPVMIKNDKGIKIEKIDDDKLLLTSFGRVFSDNSCYYEIVLAHDSDITKKAIIKVQYEQLPENEGKIRDEVPTIQNRQRSMLRSAKSVSKPMSEPSDVAIDMERNDVESYVRLYGINTRPGKDFEFEFTGGTLEYMVDMKPENSILVVQLTSDFITYTYENKILRLTADLNDSIHERKCLLKVRRAYDPFTTLKRVITQKGYAR